jgi:hypothetical protein
LGISLLFKAAVETHVSQPEFSLLATGLPPPPERGRLCRSMYRSPYKSC